MPYIADKSKHYNGETYLYELKQLHPADYTEIREFFKQVAITLKINRINMLHGLIFIFGIKLPHHLHP